MVHQSTMKVLIVLFACVALAMGQAGCPKIITRSGWGARPPNSITYLAHPLQYVVIHHAESAACTTQSSCTSLVQGFQDYHMDVNGWADIGYNWLIGEDGNTYEGRGWDRQGAHSPGYNSVSQGICFIGSFMTRLPNAEAIANAKQLIQCGMDARYIQYAHSLLGHRQDVSTDCPGDALYNEIKTWNNYDPSP